MVLARGLAVCALYVAAGKLGLSLALVHASATPVWPPTGIALAALLVFGMRMWPAVFVGAFLVNVTTAESVPTSLAIAAGNTIEALAGAELTGLFARGRHFVDRAWDFVKFSVLAGVLSTAASATIGVTALVLSGSAAWTSYTMIWFTWWLGDGSGALIVTPVLVLWAARPRRVDRRRSLEATVLTVVLIATSMVVFGGGWLNLPVRNYPLSFLTLPPLMWAAFRLGPRAAATCTLLLAAIAVWGTVHDFGPFVLPTNHESLVLLRGFLATIAVTTLTVALVVAERARARAEVEAANRAKDEFLAIVSHELRTPLNAVVGWTSMLRSGELDPATTAKALETIERNAQLQANLIENLLDVSRMVLGQMTLDRSPVPLAPIVNAAVDGLRPAAEAKNVTPGSRIDANPTVLGDVTRLQQIVSNLVANAVKFTPAGERVHVSLTR